jgi:ornithine cyclodeaminase
VRFLDAGAVGALGPAGAVQAITDALRGGLDPATDPPRATLGLSRGQFLLMPSEVPTAAGVKIVTVAPDNPARGYLASRPPTCCSTPTPSRCARCSTAPR